MLWVSQDHPPRWQEGMSSPATHRRSTVLDRRRTHSLTCAALERQPCIRLNMCARNGFDGVQKSALAQCSLLIQPGHGAGLPARQVLVHLKKTLASNKGYPFSRGSCLNRTRMPVGRRNKLSMMITGMSRQLGCSKGRDPLWTQARGRCVRT